jgi:hypothetical protein
VAAHSECKKKKTYRHNDVSRAPVGVGGSVRVHKQSYKVRSVSSNGGRG